MPAGEPLAGASLVHQGQQLVATEGCLKCHSLNGDAHIGPTFLGLYGRQERLQSGLTLSVDEAYITQSMMDPGAHLVAGYPNVMPTYWGRLTGPQTAAIVEFIKSLRTPGVREGPSEGPLYEPAVQP
jgi:cytochrome c oxidase subunit 2